VQRTIGAGALGARAKNNKNRSSRSES